MRTQLLILLLSLLTLLGVGCSGTAGDPTAAPYLIPTWDFARRTAPAATPAITANAPAPANDPFILAYIRQGNLFVTNLARHDGTLLAGSPRQLTASGDVTYAAISPDGRQLLYTRAPQPGNNELYVSTLDGSSATLLVSARDLPPLAGIKGQELARVLQQVAWLPDARTVAFNTITVPVSGAAILPSPAGDLWLVAPGQRPQERFPPGTGARYFAISRHNQVLMAAPGEIVRADLDEGLPQTVVAFEPGDEAIVPRPQWTAAGEEAYVAIPVAAATALWRIPRTGPAQHLGDIIGHSPSQPLQWTRDGQTLAYGAIMDAGPHALLLAAADGSALRPYTTAPQLDIFVWSPDARHFLYGGAGSYAVGTRGAAPVSLTLPSQWQVWDVHWLTETDFIVGASGFGAWEVVAGHVDGTVTPLLSFNHEITHFDVWPSAAR